MAQGAARVLGRNPQVHPASEATRLGPPAHGSGLGQDLLQDALRRILAASQIVGVRAVLVHALDEDAALFWKAHEFVASSIDPHILLLPIETVADAT